MDELGPGTQLRKLRERLGLSIADVSVFAGYSESAIGKWERIGEPLERIGILIAFLTEHGEYMATEIRNERRSHKPRVEWTTQVCACCGQQTADLVKDTTSRSMHQMMRNCSFCRMNCKNRGYCAGTENAIPDA